jgi:predicted nucleotidyltransferase
MMEMESTLGDRIDKNTWGAIVELCRRWGIRRLALFGSVLRSDFTSESDIDILVEFEVGATPGFDFMTIQSELSEILGRRVDLHTPASLSKYYREDVLREAETLYDAA